MITVNGTYQNGYIKLDREYNSETPVKVIITFLEDVQPESESRLSLSDFSFAESKKILKNLKTSLSEEVIAERRADI